MESGHHMRGLKGLIKLKNEWIEILKWSWGTNAVEDVESQTSPTSG